ncbi:MAG: tetratricopeptide repeat protein [Deltaproteobacteria bacterium]|jgi:hypothetical protein|nr:tetratricopeptide repeat protein [Deltaproteobacteria bacterium]MBW2537042.1 tetratricopeptide repeat protein [Deltaproteobacteria bacterium]
MATIGALLVGPRPVAAAPGPVPSEPVVAASAAEQTYLDAQDHYKQRRYTEALRSFEQLARESDSPNARLYVARCLRELGRVAEAFEQMRRTAREASRRAASEPRYETTRDVAETELKELRAQVGLLSVRPSAWPAGLEVEINSQLYPRSHLGEPVAVPPGRVHLRARAPGYQELRTALDVSPATEVLVPLVLHPEVAPALSPPPPPSPAPSSRPEPGTNGEPPHPAAVEDGASGYVVGGITFVGIGVVGWIVFAVAGTMADARFEEIEEKCGGVRCTDPAVNESIDEGRVMDHVANGGVGVGVVGFVTAGVLFAIELVTGDDAGATTPAEGAPVSVSVWSEPLGQYVGLRGTF